MCKGSCGHGPLRNWGLLALRVAVGLVFAYHGWLKLGDIAGTAAFFGSQSIPAASFFAYLVGLVELVGGLAVLLGIFTKAAAKLLAINMIVALLIVHTRMPWATAELPLVLLGGCLVLLGCGGGKWILLNKDCTCKLCGGGSSGSCGSCGSSPCKCEGGKC